MPQRIKGLNTHSSHRFGGGCETNLGAVQLTIGINRLHQLPAYLLLKYDQQTSALIAQHFHDAIAIPLWMHLVPLVSFN
jgi:hypothetical protein